MAIGFWQTIYLIIKTIYYMHLFITKYLFISKTIIGEQLIDQLNELNNNNNNNQQNNPYPSLSQLESYRINNNRFNSNVDHTYNFYTTNPYQSYMPISRIINLSYPSSNIHENKWNTYLNRVNNQYTNHSSINHISNGNIHSINQSHYTSIRNIFPNLVSKLSSPFSSISSLSESKTSLGIGYTPEISHPFMAGESQTEQILKYILTNYKSHERPNENSQDPTIVSVFIHIIDISSSNVVQMEYTINCYLRQQWYDPRLSWDTNIQLSSNIKELLLNQQKNQLWLPDLFFRNGKSGFLHDMSQPNYLLRVKSNGQVLYSQKITMTLLCQMYLRKFPMDKQECTVNIGSYGYTIDQLKFIWHHDKPVTISNNLQLLEFESPHGAYTLDCTKNGTTNTGTYSCLLLIIPLRRLIGSYIVTTYIPEVLIVMVSWLGFWIDIKAVPARVTLGLLTLLGLLTESSSVSSQLPKVTYLKAIDVWLTVCLLFVIAALAEFAYAYLMTPKNDSPEWEPEVRDLVKTLLVNYTGEIRCCCCFTKNRHHKPIFKDNNNNQRSQSHQPRSYIDTTHKKFNSHTRDIESDPEFTMKSTKKSSRTSRSRHIKSTNLRCKVCESYQPVCCTCPACARLKCPEAPRKKPTQVKISTKQSKLKSINHNELRKINKIKSNLIDYPKIIKPIKKTKLINEKQLQSINIDSCHIFIEPFNNELLLLNKQPKKSALKVKQSTIYNINNNDNNNNNLIHSNKELKITTFLDHGEKNIINESVTYSNHNNRHDYQSPSPHPPPSSHHSHLDPRNHHDNQYYQQMNQSNKKLWYFKNMLYKCICCFKCTYHDHDHHDHHHHSNEKYQPLIKMFNRSSKSYSCKSIKFINSTHTTTNTTNTTNNNIPYESKIDAYSRFIFPIFFVLFLCIYWFFYLVLAKD
ncbi:Gamma-aminobutyric acid receptor subunit beta-3 [Schistosoma haematobium]|uniref:Gamma-aminobutyric acid receptor subunit beta-3 n=1 Tax=Schistosoma haematobium TaxID=6185 RepID=A0A922ILS7_SCHHA|nr:Gamma-aminobutyric acid receptor subunit beta-3 [Schistosoma haematobium]KAH9581477.1 Gamma-aminobutyric acid receptor subunit beta-3 [Schistosoma haematobium]